MSGAYAIFAECPTFGGHDARVDAFMEQLQKAIDEHDYVIMAERHMVACPNFRRAFRSSKYRPMLSNWIKDEKIQAAMFDGRLTRDGGIDHLTFNEFQDWFNQHNLFSSTMPDTYKATSPTTQHELDFFDIDAKKIFTTSRNRDLDFVKNLLVDLDNPVLISGLGKHHAKFKSIAQAVYDDGSKEGEIRVKPYPRDDGRNIHQRFDEYLREQKVSNAGKKAMLGLIGEFSDATMALVTSKIAGGTPVFSPMQNLTKDIFEQSHTVMTIPKLPRQQNTRKLRTYEGPAG